MNTTEVEGYGYDPCQDLLAFTQYHGNNHDDFQLMAEFHEQIGPNPVFMIPDKPAGIDHFDINSFAVCLLSKDVQESANGFKAGRGSQTVIRFTCPGFRSYVFAYYFALCDIHARGYMRQFCMTFVSPDRDKLMHNFVPMKTKFDEVAAFLCHGNHKMFLKDVKKCLKDLNHTLAILEHSNAEHNGETDGEQLPSGQAAVWKDALDGNLDSVRASIEEMEEIKSDLEKEMKDAKYAEVEHHMATLRFFAAEAENTTVAVRRKQSPSDSITPDSSPSQSVLRHDSKRFERKLRFLSELAPRTYSIAYSKLEALHKEFSPSSLHLTVREMEGPLFQDTASVIAIGNVPVLSFASDTGEGEEEFRTPHGSPPCVFSDEEAGDGMRVRLNSDGSMVIVSALSSPFEGNDRDLDVGGHAKGPLVTTGSDTRFTSHSKDSPVEDRHLLSDIRDDGQPSPAVDVIQPPLAVDSVDKLSSSMDDVCQLPPSVNSVANPASSNDAIIDGYKGNGSSEQEGATDPHALSSSVDKAEVDRSHSSVEHPQVEINPLVPTLVESAVDSLTVPVTAHSEQYTKGFGGCVHRGPMRLVINDDSSNSLSESEFTTPAEDKTIFFSEPTRVYREHTHPWHYYTEHIFNITGQDKRRAGKNIFAFCRHHGAVKDILYALLRGRTLVILGKQKKQVQGFIQTLCLFVPGSGREHKVCQWLDGQEGQDRGGGRFPLSAAAAKLPAAEETLLCMSHLQDYKLIGMNSAYSIPKQLLGIVSSWDLDTGKLQTPVYTGKLLHSIASRIKSEKSEEEFVARIHSVFVELAMKAFTYYHALMKDRLEKSRDLKESRRVLGLLNSGSDSDIVKYLSSIVISQQLVEAGLRTAKPNICVTFKPNKRIECKARQYHF